MAAAGTADCSGPGFPGPSGVLGDIPQGWAGTHRLVMNEFYLTLDYALVDLPSVTLGFCKPCSGVPSWPQVNSGEEVGAALPKAAPEWQGHD